MRISKKFALVALVAFFFGVSASSQIFYKIEGKDLKAPSYIFGTHHLAPLSIIDSIPGCRDAYNSSKQVVGEIDMTIEQMQLAMKMQPYMMAPQDSTLSKVISAKDFERINEEFKKWAPMPGMDLKMLDMMKPMVVTSMVSVQMVRDKLPGFNPTEQLDTYFQLQGKQTGKNIVGLETPEYQAGILYGTEPISKQAKDLIELLDNPEEGIVNSEKLNKAYLAQDLEALLELAKSEDKESTPFMEILINKRNADWLTKLPAMMAETPAFIAVGALHLPGKNGVLEGLRKAGYKVTPIRKK